MLFNADNLLMLKTISLWAVLASTLVTTAPAAITEVPKPENIVQEDTTTVADVTPIVTAPSTAKISFERIAVSSTPAPKPEPKPEPPVAPVEEKVETPAGSASTAPAITSGTPSSSALSASKQSTPTTAIAAESAPATTAKPVAVSPGSVQAEAASQMAAYGWGADQLTCLTSLWEKESNWNYLAQNSSSGAYGIPQALPGSKMASAGADWKTNPATQIKWGLGYIAERYKTPCGAWSHSVAVGWY